MSCWFYMKCFTHAYTQRRCKFEKIISTDATGCFFTNVTFTAVVLEGNFVKTYHKSIEFNLFFIHLSLFWIDERIHFYSIYMSSINTKFHWWYESCRRHFKCIFNESVWISITISPKFAPKGPIDYKPALVQVTARRRTAEKPLSEPMLTQFTDAYTRH